MTLPAARPARYSQSKKILDALSTGPKSAAEIHQLCGPSRLNSRVAELRKRGHVIECERVPGGSGPGAYVYTLTHDARSLGEREASPTDPPRENGGESLMAEQKHHRLPLTETPPRSAGDAPSSPAPPLQLALVTGERGVRIVNGEPLYSAAWL